MTEQDKFLESLEGLRRDITSIAEEKLSKTEFEEQMSKAGEDIKKLMELREKDADRTAFSVPDFEPNACVAKKLVALGIKSAHGHKDAEGFAKPLCKQFGEDPITGQTRATAIVDEDVRSALKFMDEVFLVDRMAAGVGPKRGSWDIEKKMSQDGGREIFMKHFPEIGQRYDELTQALAAVQGIKANLTTSTASDWVPTGFTSDLLEILRVSTPSLNLIPSFQQPTKAFDYPLLSASGTAYDRSEGSTVTQGEFTTAKRTFTAKEPAVLMKFTGIVEEDSIVAMAPTVRRESIRALAEAIDMGIVNGDTGAAAHIDNDLQGTGRVYHAFDGLRQYSLDNATVGNRAIYDATGGSLTAADVGNARAVMKKYGQNSSELALLLHPVGIAHLLMDANVATVDKFGPMATILTGQLGSVWNIPIFVSHALDNRQDTVTAAGFNESGGTNTFSVAVLFNRFRWLIGDRRQTTFEQDKNIETNIVSMVTSLRMSLSTVEATPTNPIDTPHTVCIVEID